MGCALILYHGSIKERGFSRRAERQRIWFTFFAERIRRSAGKVWVFNKDNPNLFKDTRWLLTLLINEALLAEDENAQLLEEKRVGRLIHAGNLQEVQNAIFKSFYRGTAGDNSDTENENDGEETTEEGNRAAVQEN